jgi:hypothetical protein
LAPKLCLAADFGNPRPQVIDFRLQRAQPLLHVTFKDGQLRARLKKLELQFGHSLPPGLQLLPQSF